MFFKSTLSVVIGVFDEPIMYDVQMGFEWQKSLFVASLVTPLCINTYTVLATTSAPTDTKELCKIVVVRLCG